MYGDVGVGLAPTKGHPQGEPVHCVLGENFVFRMSFILKKRKDGTLSLVLPIWFRILFLFIAILLAAGIFTSGPGSSRAWIPILIMAACIAGALYEEKWTFNSPEGKIEYISGILFIGRKKSYALEEAEVFKITGDFHLGNERRLSRLRKKMVKFSLILSSGQVLDIDITTGRTESIELKEKAEHIAAYCGVQLSVDSDQ